MERPLKGTFLSSTLYQSELSAMPVHRDREKKDGTAEEMEVEDQEQEGSSSEEEDSETSSVSEDGDSSGKNVRCGYVLIHNTKF